MMTISSKENYLTQLNEHFLSCVDAGNRLKDSDKRLAEIKGALQHSRNCAENILNYIILEKVLPTDNPQAKIKKKLDQKIDYIYGQKYFDFNSNTATRDQKNAIMRDDFTKLRFGGNAGSHSSPNINENPTYTDYEYSLIILKKTIEWFYKEYSLPCPDNIKNAIENNIVDKTDLPDYDDWSYISSQYENFKSINTQFILVTSSNFTQSISLPQAKQFVRTDIDWHLIIDFDERSQTSNQGYCKLFSDQFGIENIRVYTPDTEPQDIDFTEVPQEPMTFLYLAQNNPPIENVKTWNRTSGKKLKTIIEKSKAKSAHKNVVLVLLSNEVDFLDSILDIFNDIYSSEVDKIRIAVICRFQDEKEKIKVELDSFSGVFSSIDYYLVDYIDFIANLAKREKNKISDDIEYIIPAYTPDQSADTIEINARDYHEFIKTNFIEIVHANIGKNNSDNSDIDIYGFYKGEEISWEAIAYQRGKGIDVIRSQTQVVIKEIESLLESAKGFQKFELYHEPSAGGTTVAYRIAYDIGTKDYPTVILHKFHRTETYRAIEKIYSITRDKPILVIIEGSKVNAQELIELENQVNNRNKKVVALYVTRVINPIPDKKQKNRTIHSSLDDEEQKDFEQVFSQRKPEKQTLIKSIKNTYKNQKDFITPFVYGLTAYENEFLRLESYVSEILKNVTSFEVKKVIGFIALIGKYSNMPVIETFFNRILGNGRLKDDLAVNKLLRESTYFKNAWEIRHILIADEVCKQLLSGGDLGKKNAWRSALKNWLIELIDVFKEINPDGLDKDSQDKLLLEDIFINKNISDSAEEREKFSKLITEINEKEGESLSREILKRLSDTFPEHAFFHQHLSRLYVHSAYKDRDVESALRYYDLAIKEAEIAIDLEPNTGSVYHTKGDAIVKRLGYMNKSYKKLTVSQNIEIQKDDLIDYYTDAENTLKSCINLDTESVYGYISYIYLVTFILDLGRKLSAHNSLVEFLEDESYSWFSSRIQIGLDLIERLRDIYNKKNVTDDMLANLEKTYGKLLEYLQLDKGDYEKKEKSAKSEDLRVFYRTAYVIRSLNEVNFSNPYLAWDKLNNKSLKKIIEKLTLNLRYSPSIVELRHYLTAIRTNTESQSLYYTIDFLEELFSKETFGEVTDRFLVNELAYNLYVMCSIQEINNGDSIDRTYYDKSKKYLEECVKYNSIGKNSYFEYEWLGKNLCDSMEQMVNRKELKEFNVNEFTSDFSKLQEIEGRIVSVGSLEPGLKGGERKAGRIEFNIKSTGKSFLAYFIPIKGGMSQGESQPYRFDDRKYENNQEVKFFLGFSYSGYRAWQPIPIDKERATSLKPSSPSNITPKIILSNGEKYKARVVTVNKKEKKIEAKIKELSEPIFIPFNDSETYDDYKHLRRETITVMYDNDGFLPDSIEIE